MQHCGHDEVRASMTSNGSRKSQKNSHNPCVIIGIDPGLVRTGWAAVSLSDGKIVPLSWGVIRPRTREEISLRLSFLFQEIKTVMEKFPPSLVAVEKIFVNSNAQSTLSLGFARGIALMTAGLFNAPVREFCPNTIKKAVTGYGHSDKHQVIQMVRSILRISQELSADSADAFGACLCCAFSYAHTA